MTQDADHRIIQVRNGMVRPGGSWLYIWVDINARAVAYIGATGFDPELRAHLHLTDDNSSIGRVKAQLPNAATGEFDVLAFPLPAEADRPNAKRALIFALGQRGLWADRPDSVESLELAETIAVTVERYLGELRQEQ